MQNKQPSGVPPAGLWGPLGHPPQSWQELRSWAHTTCQNPAWKSSALLASKAKRPCRSSVRETFAAHVIWQYLFFFPTQNETRFNWQKITLLWIALVFITYFTVTATYAEICTEPSCGSFLKELVVWLIELNSINLIITHCSLMVFLGLEKKRFVYSSSTRVLVNAHQ